MADAAWDADLADREALRDILADARADPVRSAAAADRRHSERSAFQQ
jgi:hypothetical protein